MELAQMSCCGVCAAPGWRAFAPPQLPVLFSEKPSVGSHRPRPSSPPGNKLELQTLRNLNEKLPPCQKRCTAAQASWDLHVGIALILLQNW